MRWITGTLYAALIAANLYLVVDWWAGTDQGQASIERWKQRYEAAKVKAQECEGCARRKARLQAAMNRMHWDAERAVRGEEIETVPEDTL